MGKQTPQTPIKRPVESQRPAPLPVPPVGAAPTRDQPDIMSTPRQTGPIAIDTGYTDLVRASANPTQVPSPQIDPPVPGASTPGFIDNDDGANIRNRPAELPGSDKLTAAPLAPATRVFVSGHHPDTAEWSYVSALLPGIGMLRGYVQRFRIATDLPEPTAKLYQIRPNDTAEQLAVQEYGSAVRDGHDLRYYENVLLFVNRSHGRAGVHGAYQDPGLFGGGGNNVQLEAGRRIWLVSPSYAAALEAVVPDGSLTNGAYAKVKRFMGHLEDILASVTRSPGYLDEVAGEYAQAIRDHALEIVGMVSAILAAEVFSGLLAAAPTGVSQIIAAVIQLGLAAFGAAGMISAGIGALRHAQQWLTLAWTAKGDDAKIAAASREFVRMLVEIAMAALAYLGVKGNLGKASTLFNNTAPPMAPAFAMAGGPRLPGSGATAAVALGPPSPIVMSGPFAMMSKSDVEGAPSSSASGPTLQTRARSLPHRVSTLRKAVESLPDEVPNKWEPIATVRKLEDEAALIKELGDESVESATSIKAEIEALESRVQQLEDGIGKAKPGAAATTTSKLPRPHLKYPANYLPSSGDYPYRPPKRAGNPEFVRHPEGDGFLDDLGNRWEFAKDQHGGPHWDVQHPNGRHTNVYSDGIVHQGIDNF